MASSSQDNYIRIWKLDSCIIGDKEAHNAGLLIEDDSVNQSVEALKLTDRDDLDEDQLGGLAVKEDELKLKSSLFTVHSTKLNKYVQYSMNLESVLYGHEDWIYTVKFSPRVGDKQPLVLLSASIDKTLVVWKYNENNSMWIDEVILND